MFHIMAIVSYNPMCSKCCELLVCLKYLAYKILTNSKRCKAYAREKIKQCAPFRFYCEIKCVNT